MKKLLITFDDETANLLRGHKNMSAVVRDAVKIYHSDISTDVLAGLRAGYARVAGLLQDMDTKIDFIARKVQ